MEELQDAIEDVQYLQAVNSKDSGPSPTEPWPFPSEKALEEFNTERLQLDQRFYSLETICSGILGLYLFGRFCAERNELTKYDFMQDVIRYRRLRTVGQRQRFAQRMIRKFLVDVDSTADEVHVLIDKTPLRRKDSTRACLAELERVRSEIRSAEGDGVNQLGVVGPLVERLASLLQMPTARSRAHVDSTVEKNPSCRSGDGMEDGTGLCSQVNTADISEADNEDVLDEAGVAASQQQQLGGPCDDANTNGKEAPTDVSKAPAAVARLAGSTDVQTDVARSDAATNGALKVVSRHPHAATGVPIPWSEGAMKYPIDLFDVIEAWVFEHLRENLHAEFMLSGHFQEYTRFLHIQHRPVTENDFILFRVLGRGGFGAVNGCKRGASGKLFAMKVMNKRRIKIRQSEDLCWNERRILEALGSPFVVSLKYAFESKNDLFLILDLMTGGDLGFHLQQMGVFRPDMAQYYTARTILGIRHLHQQGIVYRDLKPENVMLDECGRSRISDMGLACKVTPHLTDWAPEMRLRDAAGKRVPYNECVDWFSLGCILYEFLRGMSPFRTERALAWCADTIQDKEKRVDRATLEMEPEYPSKYFDELSADLCSKLMVKDPAKRLGHGGADDILAHPWFESLDRDAITLDQVDSPYVPNKDINAAPQRAIGSFADAGSKVSLSREDQALYEGWAYTSVDDFQKEVVDFLDYRDNHEAGFDGHGGGCCEIS